MEDGNSNSSTGESQSEFQTESKINPESVTTVNHTVSEGEEPPVPKKSPSAEPRKSIRETSRKSIRKESSIKLPTSENDDIQSIAERRSTLVRGKSKKTSKQDTLGHTPQLSRSSIARKSISSRASVSSNTKQSVASKLENIQKIENKSDQSKKPVLSKTVVNSVEKIVERDDPLVTSIIESKSTNVSLSECYSSKSLARPKSPPNPYNQFKYPKMLSQWPLPDQEEPRIGVSNSIASLECGVFPKSPFDHCSCCPDDKDPLNCCAKMIRAEKGCCVSEWIRKEFYYKTKSKVEKAIVRHKIFLLRGELPKLREALEERGWIQKYETTKTRMVPYGSVASLDAISLGNLRQANGMLNERALIFRLLRHRAPDFIWDCRNNFVDWNCTLRNDTLLNRFQKSFIYTSKLGMAHLLQSAHWFFEDKVASIKYPRSYNLTREADAFVDDYRSAAAVGVLKWYVGKIQNGHDILNQGKTPVHITSIAFALKKCQDLLATMRNENLDDQTVVTGDQEWDEYLNDYDKILHNNNGVIIPSSNPGAILEDYYLKAISVLKNMKEIDPQYELNGMRNIWILKPSDLCCGTGISISHNLKEIFHKVNNRPKDYYTVQKYIEHPLLVRQTKFDIRQWYLVTNTFPLTIWMFNEALLRFSSKPYTFDNYHEAIHICNTAVQEKYDDRKKRRRIIDKLEDLEESVRDENWDCEKLNDYLKNIGYKGEPYHDVIYPKMTEAIVLTMLASQEYMDKRRCSFELYGADFMVTEDLSVWLIEINTNPRMYPPGLKITERLYPAVLESLVKVVFDLPLNPCADTGGFVLAYKQNISDFQPYLGSCMFVFGKAMNLHDTPSKEEERKARGKICNPWGKQHRAWTAPPVMPRARDPGVVDLIDFLKYSRGNIR